MKASAFIGYKAAQSLDYAIGELAEAIGLPLTHFFTINFSLTVIAPERAVEIFQLLRLRQFNKWARRPAINCDKPFIPAYAYFFENERDDHPFLEIRPGLPHNVHVHWPTHIPGDRLEDFQQRLWEWLDNGRADIDARPRSARRARESRRRRTRRRGRPTSAQATPGKA